MEPCRRLGVVVRTGIGMRLQPRFTPKSLQQRLGWAGLRVPLCSTLVAKQAARELSRACKIVGGPSIVGHMAQCVVNCRRAVYVLKSWPRGRHPGPRYIQPRPPPHLASGAGLHG